MSSETVKAGAGAGSPNFVWYEFHTPDAAGAARFYSGVLGWTKSDVVDMGPNGVYQVFACDGVPIGGMMNRMDPTQSPGWFYYFNVEEIGAAITRVKQHDGTVTHGPAEVPGGQQIAHCLDPQGAIFAIVGPKED